LRRLGKEFPFEIILGSWLYPDGCAAAQLAAELKVPCVLIAQGSDVHQYLQRPVRRTVIVQALQRVAAGIVRSRELGRLLAAAGAPADKLHVIYNGVDLAVFQPGDPLAARRELGLPQEGQLLLYIGNLLPVKNPLLLLAAFAELDRRRPGPPLHLVMVGDGPLRSQARQQAEAAGLGDRVFLPGSLEAPRVARHLQAADVLCVPSDNEGVPNVMLEAFASGRPVVATRVGGIPELLTEAYLGQLVPPGDAPALAAALAATLRQPSRSEEIHRYARQFSWERTAAQYLALLRQGINP
jgi:glycosyltransferase involved in cell wall biosynthesis